MSHTHSCMHKFFVLSYVKKVKKNVQNLTLESSNKVTSGVTALSAKFLVPSPPACGSFVKGLCTGVDVPMDHK